MSTPPDNYTTGGESPIDWPEVVRRIGKRDAAIAALLTAEGMRISRVTITDLRNGIGVEPRYSVGRRLIALSEGR